MGDGCIAVVDIGKTHAKLCVVDDGGNTLWNAVHDTQTIDGQPYLHIDVENIWDWLLGAFREAALEHTIEAVVPTAHGAACALVADDHTLALPVLDYECQDVETISDAYEARARNFRETLSPHLPFGQNLGRQIFWQAQTFPEAFARVKTILTYPQYWSWRLSGVAASEVSLIGAHTDLWSPNAKAFSSFAKGIGWVELFPPMQPAWAALGPVRPDIAAMTGLPPTCRVHNGVHDSNASYLRHLVNRPNERFAVASTGTWIISFAAGSATSRLDETQDTLANVDVTGTPVACSRWMGGREFAELAGEQPASPTADRQTLARIVQRGTYAIPSFSPHGGPFRSRTGRIDGPAPQDAEERWTLASLYAALVTDYCLTLIDARGDLIIEGAFANNQLFCETLTTLRPQNTTFVSDDPTGTVAGAALLARWPPNRAHVPLETCAAGAVPGLQEYRAKWLEKSIEHD